jgi:serine/threonine protein kinase
MSVVLKAFDPSLHRLVVVKVLAPHLASSGAARQRFAREARAVAAVSHEHVIAIHAVDDSGPLPYLVMEYVPGRSLQQRLDRDGPLSLREVLRIGYQVASGLAAAHAQGLIHRDVKPANILLENGCLEVLAGLL